MNYVDLDRLGELLDRAKRCGEILDATSFEEAPVIIGMLTYCAVGGDRAMYKRILKDAMRIHSQLDNVLEEDE